MKKLIALTLAFALAPVAAFAQELTNLDAVTSKFTKIGNVVVVLLITFSVIWIIVNVVRYLVAGKDSTEHKEGGMKILYGIVGLFVILSIWGLVAILKNTFSTNNNVDQRQFPQILVPPTVGGSQGSN